MGGPTFLGQKKFATRMEETPDSLRDPTGPDPPNPLGGGGLEPPPPRGPNLKKKLSRELPFRKGRYLPAACSNNQLHLCPTREVAGKAVNVHLQGSKFFGADFS